MSTSTSFAWGKVAARCSAWSKLTAPSFRVAKISVDGVVQDDRMLDFTAGELAVRSDGRERTHVGIAQRRAGANDGRATHGAGDDRGTRFDDHGADERRIRIDLSFDAPFE